MARRYKFFGIDLKLNCRLVCNARRSNTVTSLASKKISKQPIVARNEQRNGQEERACHTILVYDNGRPS